MSDASGPVEGGDAGAAPGAEQAEGQGADVLGGLYDLNDVPEELRPYIADQLRTFCGLVSPR